MLYQDISIEQNGILSITFQALFWCHEVPAYMIYMYMYLFPGLCGK